MLLLYCLSRFIYIFVFISISTIISISLFEYLSSIYFPSLTSSHSRPTSLGAYRFLRQIEVAVKGMEQMGLGENDTEEVLQLMSPDRLYTLALTYTVAILHMVFAFLAFKNDIGFWKGREDVAGLSRSGVTGRAVCSVIIFLFLQDTRGTSWLVTGTAGVTALIDIWKVSTSYNSCRL